MINKVILLGRVGQTPEIKNLKDGLQVANFSLATTEKYKNNETTTWHNCEAWSKFVSVIEKYLSKGDLLYIEGKIKVDSWEKDGQKRTANKILITSLNLMPQVKKDINSQPNQSSDEMPF